MRIANAVAVAAMMTTPALAEPCKTEVAMPMIGAISGLAPQILMGVITKKVDEAKHQICYAMVANPLLGNKFIGARVCVDVNGKPNQGMSPVMQLADGSKKPMLPLTMDIAQAEYAASLAECHKTAATPTVPPAKAFVVPPSKWRYEI